MKKILLLVISFLLPAFALAHEVYVLSKGVIAAGLHDESVNPFLALKDPTNIKTFLIISVIIGVVLILNFFFQHSRPGRRGARLWERLAPAGPVILRVAIAVSFFYSAHTLSFLGPELSLYSLPVGVFFALPLYILSLFLFFGLFTEVAALFSLIIFGAATLVFHLYMLTYINYVGEFVALLLFGSRIFSLDRIFFGERSWLDRFKRYEYLIIRLCYGFGLFYAAINIKFIHAILTLDVVNDYNLTQFHLLFPHDPLLVVLGAGLAEIAIGLFIMLGLELRLTLLITLFYITLSLIFFRELVWPHYILYGISIYLLVSPPVYSVDNWLDKKSWTL